MTVSDILGVWNLFMTRRFIPWYIPSLVWNCRPWRRYNVTSSLIGWRIHKMIPDHVWLVGHWLLFQYKDCLFRYRDSHYQKWYWDHLLCIMEIPVMVRWHLNCWNCHQISYSLQALSYAFQSFKSLWPSDATWWQRSWSTLAQVMACCLVAPSHYLNQCQWWLLINQVILHSPVKINFVVSGEATILYIMGLKSKVQSYSLFQGPVSWYPYFGGFLFTFFFFNLMWYLG